MFTLHLYCYTIWSSLKYDWMGKHEVKPIPHELGDRIVLRRGSEEGYNTKSFSELKAPKIEDVWNNQGSSLRGCLAKLSNWALIREVSKNLMITRFELQRSGVVMGETFRRTVRAMSFDFVASKIKVELQPHDRMPLPTNQWHKYNKRYWA